MMKVLRYVATSIFALLFLLYIVPSFINWNGKYKSYIAKKLEEVYGTQVNISGNIKVSFIPMKVVVHDLYLEHENEHKNYGLSNLITIEKLEFKPSFLSLIKLAPNPKAITIYNLTTDIQNLYGITTVKDGNIKSISIVNSNINIGKGTQDKEKIHIKAANLKSSKTNRKITSAFVFKQNNYNLDANIDLAKQNTYQINAKISSNFLNIMLIGSKNRDSFEGKLTAKASNLFNVINGITTDKQVTPITTSQTFELTSDIYANDNEFKIHNLQFNSDSIKGSGKISHEKGNVYNIEANFERMDIDYFIHNQQKNINYDKLNNILESFRLTIPKHININSIIRAQEVKYNSKTSSNLEFKAIVSNGRAGINFALILPGNNNNMTMFGEIIGDKVVSKFKGVLSAQGQDIDSISEWLFPVSIREDLKSDNNKFTFSSNIYAAPRIFMISDMQILTDEGSFVGKVSVKYNKKVNIIDGKISASNINFDKYNLNLSYAKNKLPMQWLKDTKFNITFKTDINNALIKSNQVKKINFVVNTIKDKLTINNIKLVGDNIDVSGDVKIVTDFKTIRPVIEVNLSSEKFSSAFIELPDFLTKTKDAKNEIAKISWSRHEFNFLKLDEFDGDINIDIKEFKTKFNGLKDFKLNTILKDGLISVRQLSYRIGDGSVMFQGNIGTGLESSLVSSFSIANLDISNVVKVLDINNLTGNISISGSIKTQGKNIHEWISRAVGKISLAARGINFIGIDLDSFIINLLASKSRSDIASLTQFSLYNGSTFFTTIDGSAEIKNGIFSTSMQFAINNASGSASSNISLLQFTTISLFRLFFIPPEKINPVYVDLNLAGLVWQPKISFDIDALYSIIAQNN